MATNQNVHVNTFSGGMNTDTSYINMKNEQYTMAINTRVSTVKYDNTTFDETYSNQKENVLAPVQVGENQYCLTADPIDQIKDYLSIKENYIYKILTSGDTNVILYKNHIDEGNDKGKPILIVGLLTTDTDNKKQIKILFYTSATTLIFLCTRKKKNFKTVCIASFIITYCISQFGLLFPCVNPLAIVSSFSLICGGYEITWLYGMMELTLYTLLLYLFIRKRIRKVDF